MIHCLPKTPSRACTFKTPCSSPETLGSARHTLCSLEFTARERRQTDGYKAVRSAHTGCHTTGTENTRCYQMVRAKDNQAECRRTKGLQVNNHGLSSGKGLGGKESQKLCDVQTWAVQIIVEGSMGGRWKSHAPGPSAISCFWVSVLVATKTSREIPESPLPEFPLPTNGTVTQARSLPVTEDPCSLLTCVSQSPSQQDCPSREFSNPPPALDPHCYWSSLIPCWNASASCLASILLPTLSLSHPASILQRMCVCVIQTSVVCLLQPPGELALRVDTLGLLINMSLTPSTAPGIN